MPKFTFPDDGGRPSIKQSQNVSIARSIIWVGWERNSNVDQPPLFRPDDRVYIVHPAPGLSRGPFTVLYQQDKRYQLQDDTDQVVESGRFFEEAELSTR